jgi:hypothetical protein
MQRQMGCFLYDTLIYEKFGVADLEGFIDHHEVAAKISAQHPIVIKFLISCSLAGQVFKYLDVMGINGARLMDDSTGVAADVINMFNYNPRYRTSRQVQEANQNRSG